jgi:two-component system response regulator HydG
MLNRVLIVDDEESISYTFKEFLSEAGFQVDTADSLIESAAMVGDVDYDAIFLDILLGRDNGLKLLEVMHEQSPNCPIIMVTGSPEISTAAEAVRHGAFDYLVKPIYQEELVRHAQRAVAYKTLLDQKEQYQKRLSAVFQGVREGILVFDIDTQLIDMNFAAKQMLSCDDTAIGQNLDALIQKTGNDTLKAIKELVESRFDGELFNYKIPSTCGEGVVLSVNMSSLSSGKGQDADLVLVLRDESVTSLELSR